MYAWIFRHLPGPVWLRWMLIVAVVLVLVIVLFMEVFPWISEQLNQVTIDTFEPQV